MTESLPMDSGEHHTAPAITPSSISHRVRAGARLVHVTVAGEVTVDALYAARDAILADPEYVPGMQFFVDCRVITAIPSPEEIRNLAISALLNRGGAFPGRAAVVATTQRSYEAASLFELFIDAPHRLALFTDPAHARAWLTVAAADSADDLTSS